MLPSSATATGASVTIIRTSWTGVAAAIALGSAFLGLVPRPAPASAAVADPGGAAGVANFYRARGGAPLWFAPSSGAAAQQLLQLLGSAGADNLDPRRYQ